MSNDFVKLMLSGHGQPAKPPDEATHKSESPVAAGLREENRSERKRSDDIRSASFLGSPHVDPAVLDPEPRFKVSNAGFLSDIFPAGATTWVCSFIGAPQSDEARWLGRAYLVGKPLALPLEHNTYFCTAQLKDGSAGRTKRNFERLQVLVADDPDVSALRGMPTYVIRTSDDKRQVGLVIKDGPEARDLEACDRVVKAMVASGLMKLDKSGNNLVRYVRLPVGSNTKYGHHPAHVLEQ